jgi:DedD protein
MDRALKERIIGASVLVFFAVLIVPVFLDGPAEDTSVMRETVTLPGQSAQGTRQQTIVLNRDRTEPVPQATRPQAKAEPKPTPKITQSTAPAPTQSPTSESVTPVKKETPAAKPVVTSETGMWAVQMGSFSNKVNAERLATNLRKDGFAAFLSQLKTSSGELHRVRIGPQKDRDSAESIAAQLGKAGHKGQVVPHP